MFVLLASSVYGATWERQSSQLTGSLTGIDCADQNNCWIVGGSSTSEKVQKTTNGGASWVLQSGTPGTNIIDLSDLRDLDIIDSTTGYILSRFNGVFKTVNGDNWQFQFPIDLDPGSGQAIAMVTENFGFMLTPGGTLVRTSDGFNTFTLPTFDPTARIIVPVLDPNLAGNVIHYDLEYICDTVTNIDTCDGWAVGASGRIAKAEGGPTNSGNTWVLQPSGVTEDLRGVFFITTNIGWVVGNAGTILKTTDGGATWASQTSGVTNQLNAVHFFDLDNGYVVGGGTSGVILRTVDGGATWTTEANPAEELNDVHSVLSTIAFAVGDSGAVLKRDVGGTSSCGNGVVEGTEECDDGNQVDNDGCSRFCVLEAPVCGNGLQEAGETCDDGNLIDGDGCDASCQIELCGNGVVDPGEQCDDGNINDFDTCTSTCQIDLCGNNNQDIGEACDDGNRANGDGCSRDCQSTEFCGNNYVDFNEQCDDGNTVGNDGCTSLCLAEGMGRILSRNSPIVADNIIITNSGSVDVAYNLVQDPQNDFQSIDLTIPLGGEVTVTFIPGGVTTLFPGTYSITSRPCTSQIGSICSGPTDDDDDCGFLVAGDGSFDTTVSGGNIIHDIASSVEINAASSGVFFACARDGVVSITADPNANLIAVRTTDNPPVAILPESLVVRDATGAVVSSSSIPPPYTSVFYDTGLSTGTDKDNNCVLLSNEPGSLTLVVNGQTITQSFSLGDRLEFEVSLGGACVDGQDVTVGQGCNCNLPLERLGDSCTSLINNMRSVLNNSNLNIIQQISAIANQLRIYFSL